MIETYDYSERVPSELPSDAVVLDFGDIKVVTSRAIHDRFAKWWKKNIKKGNIDIDFITSRNNGIGSATHIIIHGKKKTHSFDLTEYSWW